MQVRQTECRLPAPYLSSATNLFRIKLLNRPTLTSGRVVNRNAQGAADLRKKGTHLFGVAAIHCNDGGVRFRFKRGQLVDQARTKDQIVTTGMKLMRERMVDDTSALQLQNDANVEAEQQK